MNQQNDHFISVWSCFSDSSPAAPQKWWAGSRQVEEKKHRDSILKTQQWGREKEEKEGNPPRKDLWFCWSQEKVQHTRTGTQTQ